MLTTAPADGERRDTYVNPEAIAYFKATSRDDDGTYVHFIGGSGWALHVEESPEIILRLLEDNRTSLRAEDRDGMRALA